jgi:hypothetical protein
MILKSILDLSVTILGIFLLLNDMQHNILLSISYILLINVGLFYFLSDILLIDYFIIYSYMSLSLFMCVISMLLYHVILNKYYYRSPNFRFYYIINLLINILIYISISTLHIYDEEFINKTYHYLYELHYIPLSYGIYLEDKLFKKNLLTEQYVALNNVDLEESNIYEQYRGHNDHIGVLNHDLSDPYIDLLNIPTDKNLNGTKRRYHKDIGLIYMTLSNIIYIIMNELEYDYRQIWLILLSMTYLHILQYINIIIGIYNTYSIRIYNRTFPIVHYV